MYCGVDSYTKERTSKLEQGTSWLSKKNANELSGGLKNSLVWLVETVSQVTLSMKISLYHSRNSRGERAIEALKEGLKSF